MLFLIASVVADPQEKIQSFTPIKSQTDVKEEKVDKEENLRRGRQEKYKAPHSTLRISGLIQLIYPWRASFLINDQGKDSLKIMDDVPKGWVHSDLGVYKKTYWQK